MLGTTSRCSIRRARHLVPATPSFDRKSALAGVSSVVFSWLLQVRGPRKIRKGPENPPDKPLRVERRFLNVPLLVSALIVVHEVRFVFNYPCIMRHAGIVHVHFRAQPHQFAYAFSMVRVGAASRSLENEKSICHRDTRMHRKKWNGCCVPPPSEYSGSPPTNCIVK